MPQSTAEAPNHALTEPDIYRIAHIDAPLDRALLDVPPPAGAWVELAHVHPNSSSHHPPTQAALAYSDRALHLWFEVEDRYVVAREHGYQSPVCRDSCVEFFFAADWRGYFNLELNCGGAMLLHHNQGNGRSRRWSALPDAALDQVRIATTLPPRIDPERTDPTPWRLACTLPLSILEPYLPRDGDGPSARVLPPRPGDQWRGTFYKCADRSSHPHWKSWTPIAPNCCFHEPDRFGVLRFD